MCGWRGQGKILLLRKQEWCTCLTLRGVLLWQVVVTAGVAIASYGEINFVVIGGALQLISVMTESTRLTLVQILLQVGPAPCCACSGCPISSPCRACSEVVATRAPFESGDVLATPVPCAECVDRSAWMLPCNKSGFG